MALGNWAIKMWVDGQEVELTWGCADHPPEDRWGFQLFLYKNWLYVCNPRLWRDRVGWFANNTLFQINEGDICIGDWDIEAARGPQEAIFLRATRYRHSEPDDFERIEVLGIGCYAYTIWSIEEQLSRPECHDETVWLGITAETEEIFWRWVATRRNGDDLTEEVK